MAFFIKVHLAPVTLLMVSWELVPRKLALCPGLLRVEGKGTALAYLLPPGTAFPQSALASCCTDLGL